MSINEFRLALLMGLGLSVMCCTIVVVAAHLFEKRASFKDSVDGVPYKLIGQLGPFKNRGSIQKYLCNSGRGIRFGRYSI
jgi:hypothetical protein